jgi:type I restriction enzyme M protein
MGTMVTRRHRELEDDEIAKISDTFTDFENGKCEDIKGFCAVADIEEMAKHDFILTPGRYVGIEDQEDDGEPFDEKMFRLTEELSEMFDKSHQLEDEIKQRLGDIGYEF